MVNFSCFLHCCVIKFILNFTIYWIIYKILIQLLFSAVLFIFVSLVTSATVIYLFHILWLITIKRRDFLLLLLSCFIFSSLSRFLFFRLFYFSYLSIKGINRRRTNKRLKRKTELWLMNQNEENREIQWEIFALV